MKKKIITTDSAPKAIGPYSQGVESQGFIFLSGQLPIDPATGKIVPGDIKAQTEMVLKNLAAVLNGCWLNYNNVVKTTVYMTDIGEFDKMNGVYEKFFKDRHPARATVGVAALPKGAKLEIEAIAAK